MPCKGDFMQVEMLHNFFIVNQLLYMVHNVKIFSMNNASYPLSIDQLYQHQNVQPCNGYCSQNTTSSYDQKTISMFQRYFQFCVILKSLVIFCMYIFLYFSSCLYYVHIMNKLYWPTHPGNRRVEIFCYECTNYMDVL